MDSTGKALITHWQWAAEKGLMNVTTARLIRNACFQVLSAQEGWEQLDLQSLDVEETFRRFQNLNARNLTPQSLKDYRRRFAQGVRSFLEYLGDPQNWKGPNASERPRAASDAENHTKPERRSAKSKSATMQKLGNSRLDAALIDYPFPIREGLTARLALPGDLTAFEAKRLATFVASLAIDSVAGKE